MAKLSTVTLSATVQGDGVSTTFTPPTSPIQNQAAPTSGPQSVTLSAGNNTIAVPSGATGVLICPPTGSTNNKTFKGVNGDTGVAMAQAAPSYFALGSGVASFVINAAAIETLNLHFT
jgi:hypothetical protein